MYQLILVIHVLAAVCLVALVLVQQGKGATVGAAFGSGASQTIFGSRGSGSFLVKVTIAFVAIFFTTSIVLNHMAVDAMKVEQQVVLPTPVQNIPAPAASPESAPAEQQNNQKIIPPVKQEQKK